MKSHQHDTELAVLVKDQNRSGQPFAALEARIRCTRPNGCLPEI